MTKQTREKLAAMESILVDTVRVTGSGITPTVDEYRKARAEVHDGALFVRYMTDEMYYTRIYAKGAWVDVVSSLSKNGLIEAIEAQAELS